jgi:cytochrome c oxidase subunit 3
MSSVGLQKHPFHLVDQSPWPIFAAFAALTTTSGGVAYMHSYAGGGFMLGTGFALILFSFFVWWRDVIREATFEGHHTVMVQKGMRWGMGLFICSEVMFFFAFFWAFFHSSLAPTMELGSIWPPQGIEYFYAGAIPLLNTVILVLSGATCTWAHHAICAGQKGQAVQSLIVTLILAFAFTGFQGFEYVSSTFRISDSVYGSCFYLATGFHGFHVLIGSTFLAVCLFRVLKDHFTRTRHFGFEAAAWYWHFVDVVWLFLFVMVYVWGGGSYFFPPEAGTEAAAKEVAYIFGLFTL